MRSTILILIVLVMVSVLAYSQQAGGSPYIGYVYKGVLLQKTLPNGVKDLGGDSSATSRLIPFTRSQRCRKERQGCCGLTFPPERILRA